MRWDKVDAMWQKRGEAPPGKVMPGTDVSYELKQYEIPGESPLDVRVVKRTGIDPKKYQFATSVPRTAIMLHVTAGYGNFADLMGGNGAVSANYLLGRDGNAYECVPPEMLAWHANDWSPNSIGIEIDNIGPLTKNGNNLAGWTKDTYCTLDDKGVYMETTWPSRAYIKYWAAFTEAQYLGVARLIKALAHKFQIPRVILPDAQRYDPVDKAVRTKWKGLITHVQTNPANRADIGPVIDWDKLIRYADIELGDPVSGPTYKPPTNPTPGFAAGGGGTPAPAGGDTPAPSGGGSTPAAPTPPPPAPSTPASASGGGTPAPSGGGTPPVAPSAPPPQPMSQQTTQDMVDLPAPIRVSDNVMKVAVGKRGGRIAFSLRRPGDPVPTPPKPGDLPAPMAEGKRDDFIRDAMNFIGAPYKKGSNKPNEGVDGPGLIGLCLKRVGLMADSKDEDLDADHLAHYWAQCGGTVDAPPEHILPGDLAWYGSGDHDTKPQQVPFINLGGGRLLGPVPGGPNDGAVQIIHAKDVPEKFAGWQHIDDLGVATNMSAHPGDHAAPGEKLSGALLPLDPAGRYDALKAIVEKKGGTWLSEKNAVNLIGIKNMSDRCLISATPGGWRDGLVAALTEDIGNRCCLEL
ncbi:MAG: N-acetylmuramoyl-L-alanine amidase, partial [Deltaproteobacteria bacterium]|nr:N-acetylmuramoyl-L-alanine amidase [Deltaproteobacteria bacterium]